MLPHRRVIRRHVLDILVMKRPRATGAQPRTVFEENEPMDVRCLVPMRTSQGERELIEAGMIVEQK
jgi:hypothetical protein